MGRKDIKIRTKPIRWEMLWDFSGRARPPAAKMAAQAGRSGRGRLTMRKALAALALAMTLAQAGPAQANVTYSYLGNPFSDVIDASFPTGTFDTSMRVSGSFELANPLAPNLAFTDIGADILIFTFSNGRSTLSSGDADLSNFFFVQTDAAGQIVVWDLILQQSPPLTDANDPQVAIVTQNDPAGLLFGSPAVQDRGDFIRCEPSNVPRGLCINLLDSASTTAPGGWTLSVPGTPVVPVASPSSAALLGLGLMVLAFTGRRSMRAR